MITSLRFIVLLTILTLSSLTGRAQIWTVITADTIGDGRDASLADAAQLAYRYDKEKDFLWFRVFLYGKPDEKGFGVNLVFDTGGDDSTKLNWWGGNKAFRFDKLLTAWVTCGAKGFQGTVGIGDVAGVSARQFNNLLQNNLQINVENDSILIGVKRTDITDKFQMKLIAAVGSNIDWNDDMPNAGSAGLDLAAERPKLGLRDIDLSRNNFALPASYKSLAHAATASVVKKGQGKQVLILVPGMYSGATSFDNFMQRNQANYKFYLLTPAGLNGTRARAIASPAPSFAAQTWTKSLERDLVQLVSKEKLIRPVLVVGGHPASTAAVNVATENPRMFGGIVFVSGNLVQFFASPKDPTRKTPATRDERQLVVEKGWADKWFKYVTHETWLSNDLRAETLSNDAARGQKARDEIEQAPLEIKIRYLCEFWASDVSEQFGKLSLPMLLLSPGFDEKYLADPANTFAKLAYVTSWETLAPQNNKLEVAKIPNSRLLVFDDQPQASEEAVASFLKRLAKSPTAGGANSNKPAKRKKSNAS
jgi:pimeloyl-ACP methyl ester carboxylesterase